MWSYQALAVFTILLPGFITRAIIGALTPRKKVGDVASVIESFIFSFIIYVVAAYMLPSADGNALTLGQVQDLTIVETLNLFRPLVLTTLILAIIIGLLWSALLNHDVIHTFLRFLRITSSTARSSTWLDSFFDLRSHFITVTLEDGRRLTGYPTYYSHDQDEGCIMLTSAFWLNDDNTTVSCNTEGVLITKNEGIKRIEFLKSKRKSGKEDV